MLLSDGRLRGAAWRLLGALTFGRGRRAVFEPVGRRQVAAGLSAAAGIERDRLGIAHIEAATWPDGAFAIGFLHGCDRLAQLELLRRVAAGRIAEVLGDLALPLDVAARTVGYNRLAADYADRLDADARALLTSYCDGVNEAIRARRAAGALPVEYCIFDFAPEPWTLLDSLLISRLVTTDVNITTKILVSLVEARLPAALKPLFLPFLEGAPDAAGQGGAGDPAWGSNAWVVSGQRTADGAPLVVTDPHVGLQAPSPWYAAALRIADTNEALAGFTVPGGPFVVLGRNRNVAWGTTNMLAESVDLFYEDVQAESYRVDGEWRPFLTRQEIIKVRGGPERLLNVRATHRGVLLSDCRMLADRLGLPAGLHVSVAWPAAVAPRDELKALYGINRATDLRTFAAALETYGQCSLNFLAADGQGHIGQFPAASLPRRRQPAPGTIRDGRTSEFDWIGVGRPSDIACCTDPPEGFLANANDLPIPGGDPDVLGRLTCPPYRGNRLRVLLADQPHLTLADAATIQADCVCTFTRELLARLTPDLPAPPGGPALMARRLLDGFDGRMAADSGAAAVAGVFSEFFRGVLFARLLGPALGARFAPRYVSFPVTFAILDSARGEQGAITHHEVRRLVADAFASTVAYLVRTQGNWPAYWRWGRVVQVTRGGILARVPLLGRPWRIGPTAARGGAHCIEQVRFRFDPRADRQTPFLGVTGRLIMSLAAAEVLGCVGTGQSESPYSTHFDDQAALITAGRYVPLHLDGLPFGQAAGKLSLVPFA